jgi:ABC-type nickel/cobalt efflux system permease component RcnA
MLLKFFGTEWRNAFWKLISNPAFEVVAAILAVLFAAWVLVQTETERKHSLFPVPSAGAHR